MNMDKSNQNKLKYRIQSKQVWKDMCRVCNIDDNLVAVPYTEASRFKDYELGATIAAISANKLIRRLLKENN